MSYAGRIGSIDGVKIYIKKKDSQITSTIKITYYAWNKRTLSNPGYGTKDLVITAYYSPSTCAEYVEEKRFAAIPGNGNGDSGLSDKSQLDCGRVVSVHNDRNGDHQYNTIIIELNEETKKKLTNTVSFKYSATVNDDTSYSERAVLLIES